jgi:hypothetical protein
MDGLKSLSSLGNAVVFYFSVIWLQTVNTGLFCAFQPRAAVGFYLHTDEWCGQSGNHHTCRLPQDF